MEVMLYKYATSTMRSQGFVSLRTAHHKLLFASAAFGARIVPGTNLDRMKRRLTRPVPNDLKRQFGSVNLGSPGPLFSKATHVWAAGGARAQGRMSTGDVLGGLPSEKPRGFRGDPAQR